MAGTKLDPALLPFVRLFLLLLDGEWRPKLYLSRAGRMMRDVAFRTRPKPECLVTELPEKEKPAPAGGDHHDHGM